MSNIILTVIVSSLSVKTFIHNTDSDAYATACKIYDTVNDDTFVDADAVISEITEAIDTCVRDMTVWDEEWSSASAWYVWRNTDGNDYEDALIIEAEMV